MQLAPSERLATLPVASAIVGTAASTVPVALLMKKWGRKRTFLTVSIFAICVALLAAFAVQNRNFFLFSFSTFLLGVNAASIMQFRFASMESVSASLMPKAASYVLVGGIAAAFVGPEIAMMGKEILSVDFTPLLIQVAVVRLY